MMHFLHFKVNKIKKLDIAIANIGRKIENQSWKFLNIDNKTVLQSAGNG